MNQITLPFFKNSIKVSYTDTGVTEISFQNKQAVPQKVSSQFAKKIEKQVSRYLTGSSSHLDLPVDWNNLKGTDFQKRVWKKMVKIPYGKVKTYGDLAKSLKSPGAARAVGTACAKNPVLLIIPCHRVVGVNGLGGFSGGGLGVKRKLLDLEKDS